MTLPLIQFRDVQKRFGSNVVLKGVNLSIIRGEITAVIGKSGTGKSVLLKHIIGLMRPDAGSILIEGRPLADMSREEVFRFNKELSYMFQDNALFDSLNVFDNIALPLVETTRMSRKLIREKVHTRMEQLAIQGIDGKYPSEISGGMRKRVALARALVTDPRVVLFDEPTAGLDPVRKKKVHGMIRQYQKQFGFTAVIVTHDIPDIFDIVQHVAMLDEGLIVCEGTPEEVRQMRHNRISAFIRGEETPD